MVHIDFLLGRDLSGLDQVEQIEWLVKIFEWIRYPKDLENKNMPDGSAYSVRLKYLIHLFKRNPQWQKNFISTLSSVLKELVSVDLFGRIGITQHASFLQNLVSRIEQTVLPRALATDSLKILILEIFPNVDAKESVDNIDEHVLQELVALFSEDTELASMVNRQLILSCYTLSCQLLHASIEINQELRVFSAETNRHPETKLQQLILNNLADTDVGISEQFYKILELCENAKAIAYSTHEKRGIKVDLIYLFETQEQRLARLRMLFDVLNAEKSRMASVRSLISQLIVDAHNEQSFIGFLRGNLRLLAQRIATGNSEVGEHYVTHTWKEYIDMFRSAMGGGAITAITVYIKIGIAILGSVGFVRGFLEGLNYAVSFSVIQACGFTLATKQPSMTAPYLANALRSSIAKSHRTMVALLRTQFIAIVGNVLLAFPICFLVSFASMKLGHPLLNGEEAKHYFESTQILGSAPVFAVFTGCLLFLSSVIAGWAANWTRVHDLPRRIEFNSVFHKIFKAKRTKELARLIEARANLITANISLGFLMGLAPQVLKFFSLPLEVRHVTLSSGSVAAALPYMNFAELGWWPFVNTFLGIIVIGILNVLVAFSLALVLAVASSRVNLSMMFAVLRRGVFLVLVRPWLLIVPEAPAVSTPLEAPSGES